ncbi:chromate transporter [Butyrivibrio sp. XPD2002]|uniref:chromate transporter n=1 Tax=Butyrivibrio sp. XPD2002 TaxID=1280665 RepID=UPI0003FC3155|nr:chromate transporter [Butyrivibrio sp. XPD2002]
MVPRDRVQELIGFLPGGVSIIMLFTLFITFAKIGLFTFGGGLAMISLIENICVKQKNWITHEEMMNVTVIAESTPGPIAINCATFVGYRKGGLPGAIAATFGMLLPSFVIIFAISRFLDNFLEITWIASAFKGIRLAVGILILDVGIKMVRKMKKKALPCVIMVVSFIVMMLINIFSWKFSSISMMLIAGAVGLAAYIVQGAPAWKGGEQK